MSELEMVVSERILRLYIDGREYGVQFLPRDGPHEIAVRLRELANLIDGRSGISRDEVIKWCIDSCIDFKQPPILRPPDGWLWKSDQIHTTWYLTHPIHGDVYRYHVSPNKDI